MIQYADDLEPKTPADKDRLHELFKELEAFSREEQPDSIMVKSDDLLEIRVALLQGQRERRLARKRPRCQRGALDAYARLVHEKRVANATEF